MLKILSAHQVKQLTQGGNRKEINGTFDWAYEEEFFCRDGFRWSPDSKQIAYWQIEAQNTTDYLMIDNTDSIYPVAKPVEYPIAGVPPSPFKIGVVDIATGRYKVDGYPNRSCTAKLCTEDGMGSKQYRTDYSAFEQKTKRKLDHVMQCSHWQVRHQFILKKIQHGLISRDFGILTIGMVGGIGSTTEKNFCGQVKKTDGAICTG